MGNVNEARDAILSSDFSNLGGTSGVDIEKVETSEPLKQPSLIKKTDLTEVWHKKDDQFWIPKAQVQIDVKS